MKSLKKIISIFAIAMLAASCSKDNDTSTPQKTQAELIIGWWEHTTDKLVLDNGTVVEGPYGGNASGCNKDYKIFSAGGYEDGDYVRVSIECQLTRPNRTWSIANNKITLGNGTFDIVVLTETDFAYKIPSGSQTFYMKRAVTTGQ